MLRGLKDALGIVEALDVVEQHPILLHRVSPVRSVFNDEKKLSIAAIAAPKAWNTARGLGYS
jgi:hypothetical protein